MKNIYLSTPEIFYSDWQETYQQYKDFAKNYNIKLSVYKEFENHLDSFASIGMKIDNCDAMIVNLSPFRSPYASNAVAFEMGYALAKNKIMFAYTNNQSTFVNRLGSLSEYSEYDLDKIRIENYNLIDSFQLIDSLDNEVIWSHFEIALENMVKTLCLLQ